MKVKKFIFTLLIFSLFSYACFSQESQDVSDELPVETTDESETSMKGQEFSTAESFSDFIHSLDFIFDVGPAMYMNLASKTVSSPSPIFDPVTIGILWPNYTFISMEPSLSYFSMYYLWYDGMALPAEVENRTAVSFHFMLNLPVVIQLYLKNCRFQFSGGLGILGRFGVLAGNVAESDSGFTGTAGGDLDEINSWFWKNAHFLYISTGFSFLVNVHNNVKVGPVGRVYFPVSSFTTKEGLQGMIIDIGLKISL